MGGFWDFLKSSAGEELDWLAGIRDAGMELFSLPKRGIDYLANEAYTNEPVWDPAAGRMVMKPRPGLENTQYVPVEDMAANAIVPKLDQADRLPGPYQTLYNLGRGALKVGMRFATDPSTYALNVPGPAGRAVAGFFGAEALKGGYEQGKQALNAPDIPSAVEPGVEALVSTVMGGLGARHAFTKPRPIPKPEPIYEDVPSDALPINEATAAPKIKTVGDLNLDQLDPDPSAVARNRQDNIIKQYVERIKPYAAETLNIPGLKDVSINITDGEDIFFDSDTNTINFGRQGAYGRSPEEVARVILHEISHSAGLHDFPSVAPVDPSSGRNIPLRTGSFFDQLASAFESLTAKPEEQRGYLPIGDGKIAEVDPNLQHHIAIPKEPPKGSGLTREDMYNADPINQRAAVSSEEHAFQTAFEALQNRPEIIDLMAQFAKAREGTAWNEFEKMVGLGGEREGNIPLKPKNKATSAGDLPTQPSDILREILTQTKLTKFNKNTLLSELAAKGVPVPEEIANAIPEMLADLKARGIVNEKVGGTFTLMTGPPKTITPKPEPVVSDIEKQLQASIKATGAKPVVESKPTPKPKRTVDELVELGKELGGYEDLPEIRLAKNAAKKPVIKDEVPEPKSDYEDLEGPPEKKGETDTAFIDSVKLADKIDKAQNVETIKKEIEKVGGLSEVAKMVDKIEKAQGVEAAQNFKNKLKLEEQQRIQLEKEQQKLQKEEDKLRGAQNKEKFAKKSYTVLLSTGKEVTVRARSEKAATEYVNSKIRANKSSVTISSISERKTPLERELSGGGGNKPPDRPKFGRESIEPGDNFRQAWSKLTATEKVSEIGAIIKAMRSSGDLGHILRQGKLMTVDLLTTGNHKLFIDALKKMGKSTFSEKEFNAGNEAHAKDPVTSRLVTEFGLDLPGIAGHLKEEAFHAGTAEKIPGLGKYVIKPSERAYTSFLNEARVSEAKRMVKIAEDAGFTMDANPEVYESLMKAVNIVSSRGDFTKIGPTLNNLSNLFWAPRLKMSRAQLITSALGAGDLHPLARVELRKSLGRTVAVNMSLLGLAALAGANVETDPRSSDWGRIKIGNTRIDPWFGLQPLVRSAALLYYGQTKSSSGRVSSIKPSEVLGRQIVQSLAPGPSLGYEMLTGKSTTGYPVDRGQRAVLGVSPLIVEDIYDAFQQYGLVGAGAVGATGFVGEGVNTFEPSTSGKKKGKKRFKR